MKKRFKVVNWLDKFIAKIESDILSQKWFLFVLPAVFIVLYFSLGINFSVMVCIFLIFVAYRWDARLLLLPALGALVLCLDFLIYQYDRLAGLAANYIYYFLLAIVIIQILELKIRPKQFDQDLTKDQFKPSPVLIKKINPKKSKEFMGYNRDSLIITLVNISVVVGYLLIFGTNLPNRQNYHQFVILLVALLLVNSVLFFEKPNWSKLNFSLNRFFDNKNNVFLVLINASILGIYWLIFGFDLPFFPGSPRLLALGFFLLIANVVAFFDIANAK
ncbi:MAG: hypothetical protein WCW26_02925 [Candidatus Buchananbacteria bacterium]